MENIGDRDIQDRAYFRWCEKGKPMPNNDIEDWFWAKAKLVDEWIEKQQELPFWKYGIGDKLERLG
jgi:hypothetical protein